MMYSFYGNERAICDLRMIGFVGLHSWQLELSDLKRLKYHQGSFHRTTEADFRRIPHAEKENMKHIIHGSFRKLDYLDVQNAGDIETRVVIEKKKGQLKEQRVINEKASWDSDGERDSGETRGATYSETRQLVSFIYSHE